MTESMGYACGVSVGSNPIAFLSHSIKETRPVINDESLRGTRTRPSERLRQGNISVAGALKLQPTPVELGEILKFLLNSASALTLTDAMQDVTVVTNTPAATATFLGRFTKGTFSCAPGEKLDLDLDFIGKTCTMTGGAAASATDLTTAGYVMYDLGSGVTIDGVAYAIDRFALSIDNKIKPTYMMGQTATDLEPTDRVIMLSIETKYTATEAGLLTLNQTGPTIGAPITASLAFTNGSNSITFTFGALAATSETVIVPGRDHLRQPLNYQAYGISTTKEMITTNA